MWTRGRIDAALAELTRAVADRLAGDGWTLRPFGRAGGTLTVPTGGGVVATLGLRSATLFSSDGEALHHDLELGVGLEPALALAALFTLEPGDAVERLSPRPAPDRPGWSVLSVPAGVDAAADALAERARTHAAGVARRFPGGDALLADQRPDPGGGPLPGDDPRPSMAGLTLLAATGRTDRVAVLLEVLEAAEEPGTLGRSGRRFARRVRAWLDDGAPAPPPLEELLAVLPTGWPPTDLPSWRSVRADGRALRAAEAAVTRRHRGAPVGELLDALSAEYDRRGVAPGVSAAGIAAERIHRRQQPLGALRWRVDAARTAATAIRAIVHRFRNLDEQDPPWLRPPDRAAYPLLRHGVRRARPVILDDGVGALLTRAVAEAVRPLPGGAQVEVWLTAAPERDRVVVHLGGHRVGTLGGADAAGFAPAFAAAALFDEDPVATAHLSHHAGRWMLEVPVPVAPPPPGAAATRDPVGTSQR